MVLASMYAAMWEKMASHLAISDDRLAYRIRLEIELWPASVQS
jgi:hypothetical protein